MAIRYSRGVFTDGHLSPALWNAQLALNLPVGRCDCGGRAVGQPITRGRRLAWATAECDRCGAEAALPVVDVPVTLAA
jgi:hypothetical protein